MGTTNGHRQADEESLLGKASPHGKDAQDELQVQLCGVPVQAVSGLAFCAGAYPALHVHSHTTYITVCVLCMTSPVSAALAQPAQRLQAPDPLALHMRMGAACLNDTAAVLRMYRSQPPT